MSNVFVVHCSPCKNSFLKFLLTIWLVNVQPYVLWDNIHAVFWRALYFFNAELHRYGGGLVDPESRDSSSVPPDEKQGGGVPTKAPVDIVLTTVNSVPHSDVYHIGVPSQRPAITIQRTGQRAHQKWKGPDKISRIYGDWIDDVE